MTFIQFSLIVAQIFLMCCPPVAFLHILSKPTMHRNIAKVYTWAILAITNGSSTVFMVIVSVNSNNLGMGPEILSLFILVLTVLVSWISYKLKQKAYKS